MSSPMKLDNSTYSSDFEDIYNSSEPSICDCQNQLGHFDWGGNLRDDLRDSCKRALGIRTEYTPISLINGEDKSIISMATIDKPIDEISTIGSGSATDSDDKWKHGNTYQIACIITSWKGIAVILRRATRDRLKDSNGEVGIVEDKGDAEPALGEVGIVEDKGDAGRASRDVSIFEDKGDAGDLPRTKDRKRKISDKENEDTWTSKKKSKVSVPNENACFTYIWKIGIRLPYQVPGWEETVNSEDICKGYIGHQ